MRKLIIASLLLIITFLPRKLSAQTEIKQTDKIRVFLDCNARNCDISFIKTELTWVDYVNDRFSSNVYVMITSLTTGGGGQKYQVIFSGQQEFAALAVDTLSYSRSGVDTDDEDRRKLLKTLRLGLTRFIARTNQWDKLNISFEKGNADGKENQTSSAKDKWNYWVFRIGANGSLSSSSNDDRKRINGNFSVNRTTEKNKTNISASARYSKSKFFDYDSAGNKILLQEFIQRNNNAAANYIFAIAKKFSSGIFGGYSNGTFNNTKSSFYLKPAIEYSFFPYKDFNTRQLTLVYKAGVNRNKYSDTTQFNKIKEWLWEQNLSVNWSLTQKWGNLFFGAEWINYPNYFDKQNFDLFGFTEIRVVKGLSVNFFINYSHIEIQPYISKNEVDILEQIYGQRALSSSFEFSINLGLSYRFGSIFNNIVNPRLSGGNFFFSD
jgi:hypothetical protein